MYVILCLYPIVLVTVVLPCSLILGSMMALTLPFFPKMEWTFFLKFLFVVMMPCKV